MSNEVVYPQGSAIASVPAGQRIFVQSEDLAILSRHLTQPGVPNGSVSVGTVNNGSAVFGPFDAFIASVIVIEAGAAEVSYTINPMPLSVTELQSSGSGNWKTWTENGIGFTATEDSSQRIDSYTKIENGKSITYTINYDGNGAGMPTVTAS